MKKKRKNTRVVVLALILAVVLSGYSLQLISWQLLRRDEYRTQANATSSKTATIKAARGEILDRYGRPFAINKEGYNIVFDKAYLPSDSLNDTILTLVNLLSSTGETYNDTMPLTHQEPYAFTDEHNTSSSSMISLLGLAHYATPDNCRDAMIKRYILEDYTAAEQRIIMGVRYTMEAAGYSDTTPFTFAENVSMDTVARVEESSAALPGVSIDVVPIREYVAGTAAPHILGTVGPIYADEWEELKEKGYSYNDKVGKSGIEKVAEDTLRGKDGQRTITRDGDGNILSSDVTVSPQPGNTVLLTLDKNLQMTAQNAIQNLIETLKTTEDGKNANAGAAVVLHVNTGEILAAATYPSYDIETYQNDYQSLLEAPNKPLFNRALSGTYAPGSTFKPATAAIGLQLNKITEDETIFCSKKYTYYDDYQPSCLGYHRYVSMVRAISVSCNYYFYELGRRCGIDSMNEYCKRFGLGVPTGVEISEANGILAGKEYREKIGSYWNDGDTLQAAIGQSDNAFTPLQLAVYTSTIANNGFRYQAHFIKEVKDYSLKQTVSVTEPTVLNETGISQSVYDIVKKGMLSVTAEGTGAGAFRNYPIDIGGKTGTATIVEKGVEYDHGVFIAFAPYENPEIAVAMIVEKGGHGSVIAPAAKEIFDAYFYYQGETYTEQATGTLLP